MHFAFWPGGCIPASATPTPLTTSRSTTNSSAKCEDYDFNSMRSDVKRLNARNVGECLRPACVKLFGLLPRSTARKARAPSLAEWLSQQSHQTPELSATSPTAQRINVPPHVLCNHSHSNRATRALLVPQCAHKPSSVIVAR